MEIESAQVIIILNEKYFTICVTFASNKAFSNHKYNLGSLFIRDFALLDTYHRKYRTSNVTSMYVLIEHSSKHKHRKPNIE